MIKLVLDADGAIKLAKAGVISQLSSFAKCLMPGRVYAEILTGKEKMYEDSFMTEELVVGNKIKVMEAKAEHRNSLGAGESEAIELFQNQKTKAIVSDDRKFLAILEAEGIAFIIPTDAIALLVINKVISKTEGIKCLDRIRTIVREENYNAAKDMIGGE